MQGRLLPKYKGRYQAHPKGYWRDEFPLAARCGLGLIEFILDFEDAGENPLLCAGGIEEIKAASADSGVGVRSICADYFMQAPLHSDDPEVAGTSVKILERLIAAAAGLGVTDIVIPCVDQSSLRDNGAEARLLRALQAVAPKAEASAVNLALETDLAPRPFARLLEQAQSPRVTVNYDIGNSAALGYAPVEEFEAYGDRISDIHIKDRVRGGGPVMLGQGDADIPKVFGLMAARDFGGPLIMQAFRDDEGVAVFERQYEFLHNLVRDGTRCAKSPLIPGATVVLCPFSDRFVTPSYLAWLKDEVVTRYIVKAGPETTVADVRRFCSELMASPADHFFAITLKTGGRHIGNVRLGPIDPASGIARFGMLIGEPDCHGKGIGTEVVALIENFAFRELGLRGMRFPVVREHTAAMRLYLKLGYTPGGAWPEPFVKGGRTIELVAMEKWNPGAGTGTQAI